MENIEQLQEKLISQKDELKRLTKQHGKLEIVDAACMGVSVLSFVGLIVSPLSIIPLVASIAGDVYIMKKEEKLEDHIYYVNTERTITEGKIRKNEIYERQKAYERSKAAEASSVEPTVCIGHKPLVKTKVSK